MKILAFSDLHRDCEAARKIVEASHQADVVIGAGDFGTRGEGTADTIAILRDISAPTIIVPGNHDDSDELRELCVGWENAHFLHGQSISLGGRPFFGLGYEIPKRSDAQWNRYLSEDEAASSLSACPEGAVLITHTPPFGYCDLQKDGSHEGSEAIRDAIGLCKIRLHLCGHIHYSWGAISTLGDCRIQNLGPTINWFDC